MKKPILLVLAGLLILFFLSAPVPANAETDRGGGVVVEGALDQAELAASEPEKPNGDTASGNAGGEIKDKGGPFERVIATFLDFPVNFVKGLGRLAGLKDINILVFGADLGNGTPWHDHSLWNENEAKFIRTVYWAFASICLPFFLFVIISTGFKLIYGAANPGAREEAISSIWRWFAVMVMTLAVPLITDLVLSLSGVLTDAIRIAFEHASKSLGLGVSLGEFSPAADRVTLGNLFTGSDIDIRTGSVIGTALVKVFFAFAWLWFNIIYFIRKIVLSVMVCFTPIAGLFWALNRNVPAVAIWFGELGSNALMPVAHAIVLCVIMGLTDLKNVSKDGSWFYVLIAIYTLIPLAETIRNSVQSLFTRWAGVDESSIATRATMAAMGLGSLLGLGRIVGSLKKPPNYDPPPPPPPGGGGFSGSPHGPYEPPGGFGGSPIPRSEPWRYGGKPAKPIAGAGATAGTGAGGGGVGIAAGAAGAVVGGAVSAVGAAASWTVRAAAGAVPGTAPMGQKMGGGAAAVINSVRAGAEATGKTRTPDKAPENHTQTFKPEQLPGRENRFEGKAHVALTPTEYKPYKPKEMGRPKYSGRSKGLC